MNPATDAMFTMRPLPRSSIGPQRGVGQTHRHLDEQTRDAATSSSISLRSNPSGSPKPALLTSMSIGRSGSVSLRTTRCELRLDEEIGDEHLDIHPYPTPQRAPRARSSARLLGRDEHEVGAARGELPRVLGAQARARTGDQCGLAMPTSLGGRGALVAEESIADAAARRVRTRRTVRRP